MWVRGLKSVERNCLNHLIMVAPHVGAWIEISTHTSLSITSLVAPHVGAWIEI